MHCLQKHQKLTCLDLLGVKLSSLEARHMLAQAVYFEAFPNCFLNNILQLTVAVVAKLSRVAVE